MTTDEAIEKALPIAKIMLPPTASKIEIAVLTAELARLLLIDADVVKKIWDPWQCPLSLLPFLAHALSVDVWSNDWSEEQKRKVIAASPAVHRLKGTRGAVDRALKAFDIDAHIVEWWENDARRGTFSIEMLYYNGGPVFDNELQRYAIQSVVAAKPKSRIFSARAVITAEADLCAAVVPRSHFIRVAHPFQFEPPVALGGLYSAAVPVVFFSVTACPKG